MSVEIAEVYLIDIGRCLIGAKRTHEKSDIRMELHFYSRAENSAKELYDIIKEIRNEIINKNIGEDPQ